jgi:hypothetical protein
LTSIGYPTQKLIAKASFDWFRGLIKQAGGRS